MKLLYEKDGHYFYNKDNSVEKVDFIIHEYTNKSGIPFRFEIDVREFLLNSSMAKAFCWGFVKGKYGD